MVRETLACAARPRGALFSFGLHDVKRKIGLTFSTQDSRNIGTWTARASAPVKRNIVTGRSFPLAVFFRLHNCWSCLCVVDSIVFGFKEA